LARGLIKIYDDENEQDATQRLTAVMNVLLYLEKQGVNWDREMSLHLEDVNGLLNLITHLETNSEWGQIQAASVLAYITEAQELIPEVDYSFLQIIVSEFIRLIDLMASTNSLCF